MSLFFVFATGCREEYYVQTDCTTKDKYVGIWLTLNGVSEVGVPYRSFMLDRNGITFRVKPIYYAEDWQHIEEISYDGRTDTGRGMLSFTLQEKDGGHIIQSGGIITDECWARIGDFVEKNGFATKLIRKAQ